METRSGNEYGPLYEGWKEIILGIVQRIQYELGPIELPEPTSKALLRCRLIDLRNLVTLSRKREFWGTVLPDLVDQVRDLLCETREVWALWRVRQLCHLSEDLRR
jgi:hypothetical protein